MKSHCYLLQHTLIIVAIFSSSIVSHVEPTKLIEIRVGVILDLSSPLGKMNMVSIELGILNYNTRDPNSKARLILHTRDSRGEVTGATSAASDLLFSEKVHLVIGPHSTDEAICVAALALSAGIPMLSFSATSPSLSISNFPTFVRTALSDTSQVRTVADLIRTFRSKRVILLHENTPAYAAIIPDIIDAAGTSFARRIPIESTASNESIRADLISLDKTISYVFLVHTSTNLCIRLFDIARSASMISSNNVWLATDVIGNLFETVGDLAGLSSMKGILAIRQQFVRSKRMRDFEQKWRLQYLKKHPTSDIFQPTAYDIRAYDTIQIIKMAVDQRLESDNSSIDGNTLLKSIQRTDFGGLSGQVTVKNGELHTRKVFEISEVVGEEWTKIGTWEEEKGIDWWHSRAEFPTTVMPQKLKIVIPEFVDPGCARLLKVEMNNGEIEVGGFLMDVFKAAMDELPYKLDYDFVPFVDDEGHRTGNYNDIVRRVYLEKDHVTIADLTITSDRMSFVDFTPPILSTTLSMMVRIADKKVLSPWLFFMPWTWGLWLATAALFVFMGIAIWFLEYEANIDFRGPVLQQINNAMYFAFILPIIGNTDVDRLRGNLSKLLLSLWDFVVFLLKACFTAQLSVMYSAVQLEPAITSMDNLIKNGDPIGYFGGSFIQNVLLQHGFQKTQLRSYKSLAEVASALASGSKNGGVSAIFGESPYLHLLLQNNSSPFTISPHVSFKMGGIAFAFQKNLKNVQLDFSRAILRLTDEGKITELERKWFNYQLTSQSPSSSTKAIGFQSTWGFILVVVLITVIILCIAQLPRVRRFMRAFRDVSRRGFMFYNLVQFLCLLSYMFRSRLPRPNLGI